MADLEFGPVVKALRLRAGLSQSALAAACGMDSRNTLSRLERGGVAQPRLETLQAVAAGLDVELWRMVRWAERAQRAAEGRGGTANAATEGKG